MPDARPWYEIAGVILLIVAPIVAIIYGIRKKQDMSGTRKKGPGARA